MYKIDKRDGYLFVRFEANFDYNVVQAVIHHLTSIKEYPYTDDLWLIGGFRADIRLGELETMMREFHCHCPGEATRSKTAIVVDPGFTESVIELWVKATNKRVPFEMRVFHALADAQVWLAEVRLMVV